MRMSCIVLHTMLKGVQKAEFGTMTNVMFSDGDLTDGSIESVTETLVEMENCGRLYWLWEDDVGPGASILLGSELPESQ